MTWRRLILGFELLRPLHIGFLPNQPGTVVVRTRGYVPGKNFWGAVVANITPRLYPQSTVSDFRTVGDAVRSDFVFSYFYLSDGRQIFIPDYAESGLTWGHLTEGRLTDQEFRARLIGSYVSTKIGRDGGAGGGNLHEIEFVRHRIGSPGEPSQKVVLVGMVWIQDGAPIGPYALHLQDESVLLGEFDIFDGIVLGGERNYGFGRVRQLHLAEELRATVSSGWPADPEVEISLDADCPLRAHLPYQPNQLFKGEIDIVAGREYQSQSRDRAFRGAGAHISTVGYCFAPGTHLITINQTVRLMPWGLLEWV